MLTLISDGIVRVSGYLGG